MTYFKESNPERAPFYAWMVIMGIIAALMIGLAIYHFFMLPATPKATANAKNFNQAMVEMSNVLSAFFKKKFIWVYILFCSKHSLLAFCKQDKQGGLLFHH